MKLKLLKRHLHDNYNFKSFINKILFYNESIWLKQNYNYIKNQPVVERIFHLQGMTFDHP